MLRGKFKAPPTLEESKLCKPMNSRRQSSLGGHLRVFLPEGRKEQRKEGRKEGGREEGRKKRREGGREGRQGKINGENCFILF